MMMMMMMMMISMIMESYNARLKAEGCDMVLPLCHLYEAQDEVTCRQFDFPVVLSGHDHHR